MTLNQFDRAAALYREEPVVLYYLDHDPYAAAAAACDVHVASGIVSAVTMLSCAWHVLNPDALAFDAPAPYAGLFSKCVPPAQRGLKERVSSPDAMYAVQTGDAPFWLLCKQRIAGYAHTDYSNCQWARATGGNYSYTYALGCALAIEHARRFGFAHSLTPQLWTLEDAPPYIREREESTEPQPLVPEDSLALDADGYFDTPASYRNYYNLHKQPLLQWTNRIPPVWAQPKGAGVIQRQTPPL